MGASSIACNLKPVGPAYDFINYLPRPLRRAICKVHYGEIWRNVPKDCVLLPIHVPKTGGTTLLHLLGLSGNFHYPNWLWQCSNPVRFQGVATLAVMRDPSDRFVSVIRHCLGAPKASKKELAAGDMLRRHGRNLEEICRAYLNNKRLRNALNDIVHFKNQSLWLADEDGNLPNHLFALKPRTVSSRFATDRNVNVLNEGVSDLSGELQAEIRQFVIKDWELYLKIPEDFHITNVAEILKALN